MTNLGIGGFILFGIIIPFIVSLFSPAVAITVGVILATLYLLFGIKIIYEYDRGVLFLLGKYQSIVGPGIILIFPFIETVQKVTLRVQVADVPPQETISRDNIPLDINAVAYYKVENPEYAIIQVEDYREATFQISQTTIRSVVGQNELDDILIHREEINHRIVEIVDKVTDEWGVKIMLIEIKDVELPENLKRAMAKQAEAERERRARVILAQGELQASETLAEAGLKINETEGGFNLRVLQTMQEISAEKNSAILFPFPIDMKNLLRSMTKDSDED